jgi:hypothetical protein
MARALPKTKAGKSARSQHDRRVQGERAQELARSDGYQPQTGDRDRAVAERPVQAAFKARILSGSCPIDTMTASGRLLFLIFRSTRRK